MKIKWLGHSCFKITGSNGTRILTDPFDDNVGYTVPSVEADIVTTSHNHYDHNYTDCVRGQFEVLTRAGDHFLKNVPIVGVHTCHDDEYGAKRGDNIVFVYEMDNIRVCHLGDLGHLPTVDQLQQIGLVDVLLIPVGGIYTLDPELAMQVIDLLKPKVILPMHYKTSVLRFELGTVDAFLEKAAAAGFEIKQANKQVVEISQVLLTAAVPTVLILNYE